LEIYFFSIGNTDLHLNKKLLRKRFEKIAFFESNKIDSVNFIFVSDITILRLNRKYLKHDYPTDVITFDNTYKNIIAGDIFISVDTLKLNSKNYKNSLKNEMYRVMIHGLLHLIGYKDKSKKENILMRKKEDYYLRMFNYD
jgi:probable rRNA maturation factor